MLSVAIRPTRHSHPLVNAAREFVVNIPRADQLEQVDLAGVWSGAEHDKFQELGLTATPASRVAAPIIEECPINIEWSCVTSCRSARTTSTSPRSWRCSTTRASLMPRARADREAHAQSYVMKGEYWSLGERIGSYGAAAKASGRRKTTARKSY